MREVRLQPDGCVRFRRDLGEFLRACRKKQRIKQQSLADAVGIARPSLSAIENGHSVPYLDTLYGLMRELGLEEDEVFAPTNAGAAERSPEPSEHADRYLNLGRVLRDRRRRAGLRLRQVAELCDMSVAQLSRIERGFVSRSRAFEWHLDGSPSNRTRYLRFKDPKLRSLQD